MYVVETRKQQRECRWVRADETDGPGAELKAALAREANGRSLPRWSDF